MICPVLYVPQEVHLPAASRYEADKITTGDLRK